MIGDALVDIILALTASPPPLGHVVEWLRDVTAPPVGVTLHSVDGSRFTGVVVVVDSVPLAMVAMKSGEQRRAAPTPGRYTRPMFDDPYFYGDDEPR